MSQIDGPKCEITNSHYDTKFPFLTNKSLHENIFDNNNFVIYKVIKTKISLSPVTIHTLSTWLSSATIHCHVDLKQSVYDSMVSFFMVTFQCLNFDNTMLCFLKTFFSFCNMYIFYLVW